MLLIASEKEKHNYHRLHEGFPEHWGIISQLCGGSSSFSSFVLDLYQPVQVGWKSTSCWVVYSCLLVKFPWNTTSQPTVSRHLSLLNVRCHASVIEILQGLHVVFTAPARQLFSGLWIQRMGQPSYTLVIFGLWINITSINEFVISTTKHRIQPLFSGNWTQQPTGAPPCRIDMN